MHQLRSRAGIEHWRSHWPVCAGTVVWQLNDCWPVTSWAAVDGDGREKPLYHELKRLYADRLLTLQARDGGLVLAAVNQAAGDWTATVTLRRMSVEGEVLGQVAVEVTAGGRSVARVNVPRELTPAGPKEFLVADAGGNAGGAAGGGADPGRLRALYFPVPDREVLYPAPRFDVALAPGGIIVTARTLVRDLLLQADRLDPAGAGRSGGWSTLLPGEEVTIGVRGWKTPDVESVRSALYCVEPTR
ncbi:beta-mannosidase OS=Streptomyces violarus OX=67380 GN=FHS41_001759 PE=3 SV=1 [Streptomyces violarus]